MSEALRKINHLLAIFMALLAASVIVAVLLRNKQGSAYVASSPTSTKKADSDSFVNQLNEKRIVAIHRWRVETDPEKTLVCVFQAFERNPNYEGSGVQLTVLDPSGAPVYESHFTEVRRVYSTTALRDLADQLVLEVGYGGSSSFLHILDYQSGKVVDLISEKESDYDAGAEVRPQFRTGINPSTEPFQIMLTHGVGLASSARKYTTVFRYKDGRYQRIGDFAQHLVDDYIEVQLNNAKRKRMPTK